MEARGKVMGIRKADEVRPTAEPVTLARPHAALVATTTDPAHDIPLDPYRAYVFPNHVRDLRRRNGFPKLLALAAALPEIPYIRLSKIERGEVFARADELVRVGGALGVDPAALLIDVDAPGFSIAAWAEPFLESRTPDIGEERFAVMLGAALRALRHGDRGLTIAALDKRFGLPPVVLSRLEHAQKTLDRWNDGTVAALCRLFDVSDAAALRRHVAAMLGRGELDPFIGRIASPEARVARTRERVAQLAAELAGPRPAPAEQLRFSSQPERAEAAPRQSGGRRLPVFGSALPDGLIAGTATGVEVEASQAAGPRAFGLRVCRPTLGGGLPGHATVIVDPDRYPSAGGLAAVREGDGYRLLTVTLDRTGAMTGYSVAPDREVAFDTLDPADIAAVIAAVFV